MNLIAKSVNSILTKVTTTALGKIINNLDGKLASIAINFIENDELKKKTKQLLLKVKKMIKKASVDIDKENKLLKLKLNLAGEGSELAIDIRYSKANEQEKTNYKTEEIRTSKEWMSTLLNDILIGENIVEVDKLNISLDGILESILNKI